MFTFVRLLGKMFSIFYNLVYAGLSLYISLCMNAFTIPIFVLLYLPCKVFRIKTPKIKFKGFMLYPSWNYDTVGKSKVRTGIDYEEYYETGNTAVCKDTGDSHDNWCNKFTFT